MVTKMLLQGAVAGAAGTVALAALDVVERQVRGRPPSYAPERLAGRLAKQRLGLRLSPRQRRVAGMAMRLPYGLSWGVGLSVIPPLVPWPVSGLSVGALIWGFELVALPLVGATGKVNEWGRGDVWLDLLDTTVYALVAAATLKGLRDSRMVASAG